MGWGTRGRAKWGPVAVAALCLVVASAAGCTVAGQMADARRIDASPLRIRGVVDRVVQVKGGTKVHVSYRVDGHRFTTDDLPVAGNAGPESSERGTAVCLEAAATDPGTVRLCGQKYPTGDDVIPALGLLTAAGIAGTAMSAGWFTTTARQRRRTARRTAL